MKQKIAQGRQAIANGCFTQETLSIAQPNSRRLLELLHHKP
jgi:predicted HTH domain antitoxin